ncbi:hypothetical protein [Stenotrophomonas maltophilia]|uniref:hypothetical protein n=1 Tax=Stenotrophomonas maltophilia TaxID=40324 RepID=UPI0039C4A7F4
MALIEDMEGAVATIFSSAWDKREGRVVPDPEDLRLGNDAVEFSRATVLYADLHGSTNMVDTEEWCLVRRSTRHFCIVLPASSGLRVARSLLTTVTV